MGLLLLVTPPLYGMRSYIMPCYWALQLGNLLYIIALVITYIIVYILGKLFFMLTTGKIMPWQGIKPRFAMAVSCMWVSMTNHSIVYKVSSSLLCACHCHWECIPGIYKQVTLLVDTRPISIDTIREIISWHLKQRIVLNIFAIFVSHISEWDFFIKL